jgi:hypothetical protein
MTASVSGTASQHTGRKDAWQPSDRVNALKLLDAFPASL